MVPSQPYKYLEKSVKILHYETRLLDPANCNRGSHRTIIVLQFFLYAFFVINFK